MRAAYLLTFVFVAAGCPILIKPAPPLGLKLA